ncbi:S-adenosyl-L-methionine-dependent methyltransferase [Ochromonadaceae sp. CCMP2298]|nr:S-adenosyl-L-methionine-dependent methyltransferase [Ochromonadaceae sp. CCMP2298]
MVGSKRSVDRRSNDKNVQDDDQSRGSDSWKVLTVKLESGKRGSGEAKARFGKVATAKVADDGVDELQCRHFFTCAGCSVKNGFDDTPVVRRAKRFFESEGSAMTVHLGNVTAWRSHVKLAVQPLSKWGGLKIGLYKGGTHSVEPIPYCRVHHPRINEAVEVLHRAAVDVGVSGYAEASKGQPAQGDLRYVQMSVDRSTGRIQLTLVWNALTFKEAGMNLPRLVKRLKSNPDLWHSVSVNFQTSESNAIFNFNPKAWQTLWGPPLLREQVGDAAFYFQPQIFRQANLDAFEAGIIPLIAKNIPQGAVVAELYSGIGLVGLNVASRAKEVFCSDSNEYVDGVFDKCADSLPQADQEKVFYECFDAEEAVLQGQVDEADVLIVDPPRKGLDEGVLQLLLDTHPEKSVPGKRE